MNFLSVLENEIQEKNNFSKNKVVQYYGSAGIILQNINTQFVIELRQKYFENSQKRVDIL